MSSFQKEYLVYVIAVSLGFGVFYVLSAVLGFNFSLSMVVGFVSIHAGIILGRYLIYKKD